MGIWARDMAQQVRTLASKPDNLILNPRTDMVE